MVRWLIAFLFFLGSCAVPYDAQAQNEGNSSGQTSAETTNSATATNPAPAVPKKVWTNENVGEASGSVSVVGNKNNQKSVKISGNPSDVSAAARIRAQLHKLQTQIDGVNKTLATYKEFEQGEPVSTGGREVNKGYNRVPVEQQIIQLEGKKKDLEARMDALYEEARKKGIEPGQLR